MNEEGHTLLAVTGRATGVRYRLEDEAIIGRSSQCEIQLIDEDVSRRHGRIFRKDDAHHVEDLESQNGILLNGRRITGVMALSPGDAIQLGGTLFLYEPSLQLLHSASGANVVVTDDTQTAVTRVVELDVTGDEPPRGDSADVLMKILARAVGPEGSGSDLLTEALGEVASWFGAERALVLEAPSSPDRAPKVLARAGEGRITISRTVAQRVFEAQRALVSPDAMTDVAFDGGVSIVSGEIRSLLAAPLLVDGRVVALLHLDRRERDAYGAEDLEAVVPVAHLLALVVLASQGLERLEKDARLGARRIEAPDIVFESPVTGRVVEEVRRAARSASTVLLEGETGVGKEVLTRLLHAESARAAQPFVAVNCGALPENLEASELFGHEKGAFTGATATRAGLFESASGGTLFLDEVGECSPETQVKLLRALQERVVYRVGGNRPIEVDVRVVAATSVRLSESVAAGRMREDLFYRLSVIRIEVPPLRARPEDIAPLARVFAERISVAAGLPTKTLSDDVVSRMSEMRWPGNVRELENAVERLVILSETSDIGIEDLPTDLLLGSDLARRAVRGGETLQDVVQRVEREMILRQMARTGAVKTATAEALGISRVTLDAKLKAHGIEWKRR